MKEVDFVKFARKLSKKSGNMECAETGVSLKSKKKVNQDSYISKYDCEESCLLSTKGNQLIMSNLLIENF